MGSWANHSGISLDATAGYLNDGDSRGVLAEVSGS